MEMASTAEVGSIPHPFLPDQVVVTGDREKGLRSADQILLAAQQLQEMENSQNNAKGGGNDALDVEMGISQPTPPVENGASTRTASKERKLDFDLKLSVLIITLSMIPLTDLLFLRGPTAKLNLILKVSAFTSFTALMTTFCLMFHTIKLMAIKPEQFIPKSQLRASKILFSIAVGALVLTCICITYSLLPKAYYYFLPIALLPSHLFAGFRFLHGADDTNDNDEISPAQIKARKKALKRATQLTMSLVTTSFTGFMGLLLAIYKAAASLGAAYSNVKVSVYLLLAGGIAGTFALLLCRLLSSNGGDHRRSETTWQRTILTTANIIMTVMVVPAILIIAETILHGLLAGTMFPVLAGASAWLVVEFFTTAAGSSSSSGGRTGTEDGGDKAAHGTAYAIAVAVASVSFGTILAIFAGVLGAAVQVKACTFLLTSAFVAAVSLGVVTSGTAWMDKVKASTEFAVTVLTCYSLGTLVLAAVALFYQITA